MEHPIVSNSWLHANNSFSLPFKNLTVIKLINSLSLRHKFCMDNPLTLKKAYEHGFYFWLAHTHFFSRHGDADVCHSLLCLFVSGLYSKIHVLSPVFTFKKFLSFWIHSRRWRHMSFRLSFCSIVRFLGAIFVHNFLIANSCVKIWWTVVWLKFNSLAIIRTVSQRSDCTRACTFSTLLSIFEVFQSRVHL